MEETVVTTGKRRRPALVSLSPPPSPCHQHAHEKNDRKKKKKVCAAIGWKKQHVEEMRASDSTKQSHVQELNDKKITCSGKRQRSVISAEDTTVEILDFSTKHEIKRRRVEEDVTSTSPPPVLPASPVANLSERRGQGGTTEEEEEEKAVLPLSSIVIPSLRIEEEEELQTDKQTDATYTNLDEFIINSSQNSETELVKSCTTTRKNDMGQSCKEEPKKIELNRVRHRALLRSVQVTPPPSARMLDRKNPPPPPQRPKKRRNYGTGVYARTYPRLALSPILDDDSPPTSPRVFRSLENEFVYVMQDTPEIRPRIRPAPRMARGSRRSTRAGCSRARRSLDTPTSTMVLRSRQLNPSLSIDGGKPENQREREQRDAQRRQ